MRKPLKTLELAVSHLLARSSAPFYNGARFVRTMMDKRAIEGALALGRPFLLVYQQGRVGSTSVFESLLMMDLPHMLFHVHSLSRKNINSLKRKAVGQGRVDRNIIVSEMLIDKLFGNGERDNQAGCVKIITIVREPISLMLSVLFLNAERNFGDLSVAGGLDREKVLARVYKIFTEDDVKGWHICRWFADDFRDALGIDIHQYHFDKEQCYFTVREGRFEVLILKFEELQTGFKKGVSHFLGTKIEDTNLLFSSPHKNKQADGVHRYVAANLRLPRSVCQNIYSCQYVQHFYSSGMIEAWIKKWSQGSAGVS